MFKLLKSLKAILIFSLPFILILVTYLIDDPFMVLYSYTDYNKDSYVHKNLDYVTTEKFLYNSQDIPYDSYIFGGSTASYVSPSTLKGLLDSSNHIYSFIASGEHIIGIWSKIKFLDKGNHALKNALIVMDTEGTFETFINDIPMSMKHYEVYPSSKFNFQYKYFLDFVNLRFLVPYTHYKITKKFHPYMEGTLLSYKYYYDPITNEYFNVDVTNLLKTDSIKYYDDREKSFKPRNDHPKPYSSKINEDYTELLREIKAVFDRNNTSYRIMIGPTYQQKKLNSEDLRKLNEIFGNENVFDFTGINNFSEPKSNFYDQVHFKKYVADEMMATMYEKPSNSKD